MNKVALLGLLGAGAYFLIKDNKKKTTVSSVKKESKDYNEENIFNYYSKEPVLIESLDFFPELSEPLQKYYTNQVTKDSVNIYPDFANDVWNYLNIVALPKKVGIKLDNPKTDEEKASILKQYDTVAKETLKELSPNVYWEEGLVPYTYDSPFTKVWISVTDLAKLANAQSKGGINPGI